MEHLASTELRHRQAGHVVAREFQRTLASDPLLRVRRERREAVAPLEHRQVGLCRRDRVEAAERLVVLIEAPVHQFSRVVRFRDAVALDGVDQLGPVALPAREDRLHLRRLRHVFRTAITVS